jgi:hypothetical protein
MTLSPHISCTSFIISTIFIASESVDLHPPEWSGNMSVDTALKRTAAKAPFQRWLQKVPHQKLEKNRQQKKKRWAEEA